MPAAAAEAAKEVRTSSHHVSALDGVRGIAILTVMVSHGWFFFKSFPSAWYFFPMRAGWAGVDLFFVLSGFLITGILIRTKGAGNRASTFYMRRMLRIFPLYYAVLLAVFIAVHLSWWFRSVIPMHSWKDWLIYLAYFQNWAVIWNGQIWKNNVVGHFWSLAVEEQFYLVWPWIVWACSTKTVLRLSILGMLGALLLRTLLMWHLGPAYSVYQMVLTPLRGEGLLMGAALAAYSAQHGVVPKRTLAIMAAVGFAIIAGILAAHPDAFQTGTGSIYIFTIGLTAFSLLSGALVGSAQHQIPIVTKVLEQPWLISFGKYSYGIYVYHHIVFLFTLHLALHSGFGFVITRARFALPFWLLDVALSYAIAWTSFHAFEKRFLELKDRFTAKVPLFFAAARYSRSTSPPPSLSVSGIPNP